MDRPHLIYLHSHDTGRYIQSYGHAVATPNLQRLASDGVMFRQAFCTNPTCSPSRAALLTGTWPHQNGQLGLVNRGICMTRYDWHLARTLHAGGYHTVLAGLQHVAKEVSDIGYQ